MYLSYCFLLWTIFGLQHSLLARPFFKNFIKKSFGENFEKYFYPLIYFISQCIVFLMIYDLIRNIKPQDIYFMIPSNLEAYVYFLNRLANLFLIITVFNFDIGLFSGFTQFIYFFTRKNNQSPMKEETINTSYFYKLIRHPMYLGIILVYLTSTTIYSDVFLVNLFSIIFYVELGSYFEEKTLVRKFGLAYKIYKLKTNKYIPFLR